MLQRDRITSLNKKPVRDGSFVLYWMQAAQRTEYNHALEHAIRTANRLKVPVIVLFAITDYYPDANLRHYCFMLQGLQDVRKSLTRRGIKFIVKHQSPPAAVFSLAEDAAMVVTDAGHTRIQKYWRRQLARITPCKLDQVETNLIVPISHASLKEEFSAATFRPKINRHLLHFLGPLSPSKPLHDSHDFKFEGLDITDIDSVLKKLILDRTVQPVKTFTGGTSHAKKILHNFIDAKLDYYQTDRNDPVKNYTSNMSPYLHFGQISPLYIAREIMKTDSPSKDAYLEELIVRRELAHNFIYYNSNYDKFRSLPDWARASLSSCKKHRRQYNYSLKQFENAETHDPYWNAAQIEMLTTGKMHGYMRMYWGKKILEWSESPRTAFRIALFLNNKYELDGRDANGFAGVAWCFGKHDRPWPQRKIFGKIRYMNAAGLRRKFNTDRYITQIQNL